MVRSDTPVSRLVTASNAPTVRPPAERPVSLAAPRIVVEVGDEASPNSGPSCGARPTRRRDAVDAREVTELRNEADLRRPVRRPGNALLVAFDVAPDREAEGVRGRRRIAQLGKRNGELRRPSERVHTRGHIPDAIPGAILVVVVIDGVVALHAPRADGELETRTAIVEGIDHDLQLVGGRAHVASGEYSGDLRGLGVVSADEDVEVVVVEGGLRFRLESRLSALDRRELGEVSDDGGSA